MNKSSKRASAWECLIFYHLECGFNFNKNHRSFIEDILNFQNTSFTEYIYLLLLFSFNLDSLGSNKFGFKVRNEETRTRYNVVHCVKSVRSRSASGHYFSSFRLNTEIYGVNLRIQSECRKVRTRKLRIRTPFT